MPADAVDRALALARHATERPPAGLLTDLDGTLAPIVHDPFAVALVPGTRDALERLADGLAIVGVITGRAAEDARRILGTDRLLVIGNHGLEWLRPGAAAPDPAPELEAGIARIEAAVAAVPELEGVALDNKRLSAAVHYRNAPDPATARSRILDALSAHMSDGLEVRHGRMSVELRPAGVGDKGTAVREVVRAYGLKGLVVLGDDATDLDMFRVAAELRAAGRLRAAILAVSAHDEVPPAVADAADAVLPGAAEVAALLAALAAPSS